MDIQACMQAYIQLIENPSLRKEMGKNAQEDVVVRFDGLVILQAYQSLWQGLEALSAHA